MNNNKLLSEYIKQKLLLHRRQTYSEQQEEVKKQEIKQQEEIKQQKYRKIENLRKLHAAKKIKQIQDEKKNQEEEIIKENERIRHLHISRHEAIIKKMQQIKLYQEIVKNTQIKKKEETQQYIPIKKELEIKKEQKEIELENAKLIQQELENVKLIQQEIENEKNKLNYNPDTVGNNLDTVDNNPDTVGNNPDTVDNNLDTVDNNPDTVDNNPDTVDNNPDIIIDDNIIIKEYLDEENNHLLNDLDDIKFLDEIEYTFIEKNKNNMYEYLKNINNADYIRNVHLDVIKQIKILNNYNDVNKYFETLKKIHKFTNDHFGSLDVILLEGYIVKKVCKQDNHGNYLFWNEIKALHKLSGYPHFPYLLSYDSKKLIIYMTYCGEMISFKNIPNDLKKQLLEIKQIMSILQVNSNDMIKRNICCLGNELKIIDFGLSNNIFSNNISDTINKLESNLLELYKYKKNNQSDNDIKCKSYTEYYPNWYVKINMYNNFLQQLIPYKEKKTHPSNNNNNKIKRK